MKIEDLERLLRNPIVIALAVLGAIGWFTQAQQDVNNLNNLYTQECSLGVRSAC